MEVTYALCWDFIVMTQVFWEQHCSLMQSSVACLPFEMYFPDAYKLVEFLITSSYIPSFINPALAAPFTQSPSPFKPPAPHILALFFHRTYFILFTHYVFIWKRKARSWFPSNFFLHISLGWAFPGPLFSHPHHSTTCLNLSPSLFPYYPFHFQYSLPYSDSA